MRSTPAYRVLAIPYRAVQGSKHVFPQVGKFASWLVASREDTNFTYDLDEISLLNLELMIAVVLGRPVSEVRSYIQEIEADEELRTHIRREIRASPLRWVTDPEPRYARRVGWYAVARITKPKVVIETGVDKGLGAVILAQALRRNAAEGYPGRYYGTDIHRETGWLLKPPYSQFGEILYGDSIESLKAFDQEIDLFINDSDHSQTYEAEEYEVIAPKLSENAIILGDNSHETPALARFAEKTGRLFLFFREKPKDHWHTGAGIGFAFPARP
jgi:predicted O-methyltransferase YrrM